MGRGGFRPNALPARFISQGERVDFIKDSNVKRADFKKNRTTIQDLCDFCKKEIRIKRAAMSLRTRGWRFACRQCNKKKNFNLKEDKIWLEFIWQRKELKQKLKQYEKQNKT